MDVSARAILGVLVVGAPAEGGGQGALSVLPWRGLAGGRLA